jgi:hypothetical protein
VAAAISLFGFQSGAALATVVGVLIEVPVMLLVVRVVNRSRGWYECGPNPSSANRQATMSNITIYHNPACGTSRNVLALIRNSGEEPTVIEYLKTPPDRATLRR